MPSRSSASANFLSVLTRPCTNSLKLFVFAIVRQPDSKRTNMKHRSSMCYCVQIERPFDRVVKHRKVEQMPIVETFSSREAARAALADVWIYDQIPHRLLVQISNIVKRAFGFAGDTYDDKFTSQHDYKAIARTLAHEHGIRSLSGQSSAFTDVHMLLGTGGNILLWLDCVELCFRLIRNTRGNYNQHEREMSQITITADDALKNSISDFVERGSVINSKMDRSCEIAGPSSRINN